MQAFSRSLFRKQWANLMKSNTQLNILSLVSPEIADT